MLLTSTESALLKHCYKEGNYLSNTIIIYKSAYRLVNNNGGGGGLLSFVKKMSDKDWQEMLTLVTVVLGSLLLTFKDTDATGK